MPAKPVVEVQVDPLAEYDVGHQKLRGNPDWFTWCRVLADDPDPFTAAYPVAADFVEEAGYALFGFMLRAGDVGHLYTPDLKNEPEVCNYARAFGTKTEHRGYPIPQGDEWFLYDLPTDDRSHVIGGKGTNYRFRNGLVDSLECRTGFWFRHGPAIVGHVYSAIRSVTLRPSSLTWHDLNWPGVPESFLVHMTRVSFATERNSLVRPEELSVEAIRWAVAEYRKQRGWADASE